jgi:branched-chain amino acid transport system ATP-binding protein
MTALLSVTDLHVSYGKVEAVSGVSLDMQAGHIVTGIGPNGAGKTTLFNLIAGDLRHESGRVSFRGEEISRLSPHEVCRRGIGRTFQITSVFRRLTVIENVQTALLSHHRRHYNLFADAARLYRDSALALLDRVGLKEQAGKPGGILSHGDQRRLELAIALASEPRLLMLDEPTAGMAPNERHALMALVARIAADTGLTVLFTEHDMDVVFAVARRITVMHQGCVLAEGTPQEIRRDPEVHRIYLGYTKAR